MTGRQRKWLIGVLLGVIALAAALRISYMLVLPRIVRAQVVAALADLGFSRVTFDVRHASLWGTDLANLREADGRSLRISGVAVRYSPLRALRGRLDSIQLDGARLEIDLDRLPAATTSAPEKQPRASASAGRSLDPPFDRLDLDSCILVLARQQRKVEIPVNGSLVRGADGLVKLRLDSALAKATLTVAGSIAPSGRSLDLRLTAANVDVAALLALLPPEFHNLIDSAGGLINCSLAYTLAQGRHAASMQLALGDVSVTTDPEIGLELHGVNGSIEFDNVLAGSTQPRQVIRIDRIKLSGQEFTGALLAAQLLSPQKLGISHLQFNWAGGAVRADPFSIDAAQPQIETTIIVQRVDLRNVVALITQGRASGTGTVSGAVPIRIARRGRNGERTIQIDFGEGSLRADAPGNLRLGQATQNLGQVLEQSNPAFATDPELRQMRDDVLEAVQNFDYRLLEVRFHKIDEDKDAVLIRIHGRGNTGRRVPINLDFNVEDIDAGVRAYLRTWKRVLDSVMRRKAENR